MELLTVAGVIALALVYCNSKKNITHKSQSVLPPCRELADINTLLQNIEVYNGTSYGQKRLGGDGK